MFLEELPSVKAYQYLVKTKATKFIEEELVSKKFLKKLEREPRKIFSPVVVSETIRW